MVYVISERPFQKRGRGGKKILMITVIIPTLGVGRALFFYLVSSNWDFEIEDPLRGMTDTSESINPERGILP